MSFGNTGPFERLDKKLSETLTAAADIINTNKDKIKLYRRVAILALISASISLFAVLGVLYNQKQRDLDRITQLKGSCIQSNVLALASRNAFKRNTRELIAAATTSGNSNKEQLNMYIVRQDKAADESFPYRNCTPVGIKKFLEKPPDNPADAGNQQ